MVLVLVFFLFSGAISHLTGLHKFSSLTTFLHISHNLLLLCTLVDCVHICWEFVHLFTGLHLLPLIVLR